ncbi:MAG: hypothetical protein QM739_18530 [Propionivibrio sp.]
MRPFTPVAVMIAGLCCVQGSIGVVGAAESTGLSAGYSAQSQRLLLAANGVESDGIGSRDELFGDDVDLSNSKPEAKPAAAGSGIKGYLQFEAARTIADPVHWSKMLTRGELSSQGSLGDGIKWKLGARLDYDAVYDLYDYYPGAVEDDQRLNLVLRENYLDISANDWDFRLGKQNVVWGEMVGLFFADVVSARDMREFLLPEFDTMRIPQWAARAEYFKDDFHAELLWIPIASYDEIGEPGTEFFPYQPVPPGIGVRYRNEDIPAHTIANSNYGLRLLTLKNGWDVSGFLYSSMDITPTFYRDAVSVPGTFIYEARHDRIDQAGGTLAKDFGTIVLKAEAVYTHGRRFTVLRLSDADGVVAQNTLDWALGLDFDLPADTRLNVQVFQRAFFDHDPDLLAEQHENGYSLFVSHKFTDKVEGQVTWISSLNRTDWMFRPRMTWQFERNWRLAAGVDVFNGPALGLFGRYDANDRVYSEVRYSF